VLTLQTSNVCAVQDIALLEYERRLSAAKSAARMQHTLQRKEQVLEARRQAVLAAEAAVEMRMQQKEEVRTPWCHPYHCCSWS
jgi:hypothetical protein